jgi:hypothetical protein
MFVINIAYPGETSLVVIEGAPCEGVVGALNRLSTPLEGGCVSPLGWRFETQC